MIERAVPPSLSGARTLARLLDSVARVPGTNVRFGLDPIIGLVPGIGDVAGAVLSGYLVFVGARLGATPSVLWRMVLNIAIDTIVGSIPILGDAFDVGWRSNMRNLALLERFLEEPRGVTAGSRLLLAATMLALAVLAAAGAAAAVLIVRILIAAFR